MKPYFRLIGDVHGKYQKYIDIAKEAEFSIQLGDLGFDYSLVNEQLDPLFHRVIGGNHDNYEEVDGKFILQTPHFLGDFGVYAVPKYGDIFYIRGGYSIDKGFRKQGRDWWEGEELSYSRGLEALELYESLKPDFVISHECPESIIDYVSGYKTWNGKELRPSKTAHLLESCFKFHQPKNWIFGHHHKNWVKQVGNTNFTCLKELAYLDFPIKEEVIT